MTTMRMVALLGALTAVPVATSAQQNTTAARMMASGYDIPKDMAPYYVGFLVKGPKWSPDAGKQDTVLAKRHLAYIRRMIEEGHFVFAGPMTDGGRIQGMVIIAASSLEEAKRFMSDDPTIGTGEHEIEVHPAMYPSLAGVKVKY
jgi:uncharacterized protein YciI